MSPATKMNLNIYFPFLKYTVSNLKAKILSDNVDDDHEKDARSMCLVQSPPSKSGADFSLKALAEMSK